MTDIKKNKKTFQRMVVYEIRCDKIEKGRKKYVDRNVVCLVV